MLPDGGKVVRVEVHESVGCAFVVEGVVEVFVFGSEAFGDGGEFGGGVLVGGVSRSASEWSHDLAPWMASRAALIIVSRSVGLTSAEMVKAPWANASAVALCAARARSSVVGRCCALAASTLFEIAVAIGIPLRVCVIASARIVLVRVVSVVVVRGVSGVVGVVVFVLSITRRYR